MLVTTSTTDSEAELRRAAEAAGQEVVSVDTETLVTGEPEAGAVAPPAAEAAPAAAPAAPETPGAPETPATQDEKSGLQKRFDDLTREKYERQSRIEALERQNAELTKKLPPEKPAEPPVPAAPPVTEKPKPKLEDFAGYEEFLEALTDWKTDKLRQELSQQFDRKTVEERAADEAAARTTEFLERGHAEFADWDEITNSETAKQAKISAPMMDAINDDPDTAPAVVRYLCLHPEEANRVFDATVLVEGMTAPDVLRRNRIAGTEVARLIGAAKAAAPAPAAAAPAPTPATPPAKPKPAASTAPAPIHPVHGAAPATAFDPHDPAKAKGMSFKEYNAWRASGGR